MPEFFCIIRARPILSLFIRPWNGFRLRSLFALGAFAVVVLLSVVAVAVVGLLSVVVVVVAVVVG